MKYDKDPSEVSLEDAKVWLRVHSPKGAECPCCTQHVKIYKRHINSSMAFVLIMLHLKSNDEWIHVQSWIHEHSLQSKVAAALRGDFAKLRYWGLIETQSGKSKRGGSPGRTGYHRITERGHAFAAGEVVVPKYACVYAKKFLGFAGGQRVSIRDALGSAFDYAELMSL